MRIQSENLSVQRRRINLTISADVIAEAKALSLNTSQAAEAGIREAVRRAREADWRRKNHAAISAHNARIDKDGPLLTPDWARE
ncbi:type II toxin-antitoxin system CcdA family antitoxin [Hyphobacterium sp.]|uniref:type II toxin-antitoxin system CcdA family antitoxin n=1 Tax=Hyphobacterium sp. TaxID=2004662 RepID=UPI003747E084